VCGVPPLNDRADMQGLLHSNYGIDALHTLYSILIEKVIGPVQDVYGVTDLFA